MMMAIATALVTAALDSGGDDNVSVVVIDVAGGGEVDLDLPGAPLSRSRRSAVDSSRRDMLLREK